MLRRITPFFLLATFALAQDPARLDQVVQSYTTNNQFMGSVLVARGNDVLFSKSYGQANLEWNIPNTPQTKFRLGSLTKQFTAACILLLEERGKLNINDLVKKYMPDAPAAWDKITLYNVLTHTAGIPNFTAFPDYPQMEPFATPVDKLVAKFRDKPLDFEPGEKFSYSNSGYVLLGYLIEKISGQSYEKFVQENLFTPLGMKDSGYDSNSAIIPRRAAGYANSPAGPVNAGYINMTVPHGAGALYSTSEDLLRWEQGLFGGKLLSAASLAKMTTPFKSDYAFGLIVQTVDGRKQIAHNGGIEGFNTALAYYPETKITVVALSNINSQAPDQMLPKLAAVAHGQAVQLSSERKEITVPRPTLAAYVGTYQMAPKVNMMITLDGDRLTSQMSGQGKIPLFAETETKFFVKVVDAQVEFLKDDKGAVTDLVLHQNGRDMKAPRTSSTVAERKEITLAPAILAAYAGSYKSGPMAITVTLDNGQLMFQLGPQPKLPLFAESETSFFLKPVDAQVEFVKESSGVVALILHQGPRDLRADRSPETKP
jgi:CubicO group peptidase (beta-lactamase class C family)